MIYFVLGIFAVLFLWFLGKVSKPACGLMAFVGTGTLLVGSLIPNLTVILFGLGLTVFSCLVFMAFNGGN